MANRKKDVQPAPLQKDGSLAPGADHRVANVVLRIRRQLGQRPKVTWDTFTVPRVPRMTVLGALLALQRSHVSAGSSSPSVPAFEAECCQGACGACTMVINGSVRLACRTLVDDVSPKGKVITLEPLGKFPLVRDLVVDRTACEEAERELAAWVDVASESSGHPPVLQSSHAQRRLLALGRCISCAACMEVCPQYGHHTDYLGPAALTHAQRLNETPVGRLARRSRLALAMAPGGIADCGKATACVEACPVGVPILDALQSLARDTTREMVAGWLLGHES